MIRTTILRVVSKVLIPFILLFAFYTQFHGDYGPGGGFQAGVIAAAGVILHGLIFGLDATRAALPPRVVEAGAALGVLLYAGTGLACVAFGGNFLEYGVLRDDPVAGQHLGILLVELGVGITVASVMVAILGAFAARGREM